MKSYRLVVLLLGLLLLVGCGGAAPAAAPPLDAATVDLATLPDLVDASTVAAVKERSEVFLLDVREPSEYAAGHIPGINLIPMGEVPNRLSEIPKDKTVIVSCQSGRRSSQIASFLREQGYSHVHDLQGGFGAWTAAGLPVEQ